MVQVEPLTALKSSEENFADDGDEAVSPGQTGMQILESAGASAGQSHQASSYFGVIDIGSNSVRLVVYSGLSRVADSIFNEKILCGLGSEVGTTGRMGDEAVAHALSSLKRFRTLTDHMEVSKIDVVATAATRDAENGADFVAQVLSETGFKVNVIAGVEEARLSALGVISGDPTARGIMGDLGGGSLELARMRKGKVLETISLPIGSLRLVSKFGSDRMAMKAYLDDVFAEIDWLDKARGEGLYVVGGSWRNMAKLMMHEQYTPLPVLHGFKVRRSDMRNYATRISRLAPEHIPFAGQLSQRRRDVLPVAALTLSRLIKRIRPDEVHVSSYGLREGVIYDRLPKKIQKQDPFLHQCRDIATERCRFAEHADVLFDWTRHIFRQSVFESIEKRDRLHMAVCLLSDVAWRGHPDFRAEKAVETILHGQFVGVSHKGRAYIALALNEIYGASLDAPEIGSILALLSAAQMMDARLLGSAIRLGQRLSGGARRGLDVSKLIRKQNEIILSLAADDAALASEVVMRRLEALSQLAGLTPKLEIRP